MARYDNSKSLGQNAMAGVDITMPDLPDEVVITDNEAWHTPESLSQAINDFLYETYGAYPSSYDYEIVVGDLEWEED